MTFFSDALHEITLYTSGLKPLLVDDFRLLAEKGIQNLPVRYPGLKVARYTVHPNRVEMILDFHRLDEDVLRVLQSFKLEVKNLAKKKGLQENHLWQWNYEEKMLDSPPP
jgi:hypothetical protein